MADSDRPSPLEPGYRIDRYELLYAVAQGGMGSVWVARLLGKHGFEKLYAIKTILPQYASDERFRTMFLDEARIASGIDHPNVVQVLDLGEQQGILYTVMEWVEGDSLHRIARLADKDGKKLPLGVVLRILADTSAGLHAAHELADSEGAGFEIVHRDVSPQNILVSTGGSSKLIDFGVAKARDRLAGETSEAVLKGKVRYVAVEQVLGSAVDRRADIWSMGAVLHTVLAGSCPFPGESDVAILRAVLSGVEPRPPPEWVPKPVAGIIERCLQRDPALRFGSALEMQRAIEGAMVASGHTCTASEVGSFVSDLTKERMASRKSSLQLARRAVAERQRIRELLEKPPAADPSGSDVNRLPPQLTDVAASALRRPPADDADSVLTRAETRPAQGEAKPSDVTSAEASISLAGLRAPPKRGRTAWLIALVGVATFAAMGFALRGAFVAGQNRPTATAARESAPPELAVPAVPPSATSAPTASASAAASATATAATTFADAPPVQTAAAKHAATVHATVKTRPATTATATGAAKTNGGELGGTIDSRK